MTARVVFTAGFSRRYTGGVREFAIEAKNLRGVIKAMDELYPGLGHPPRRRNHRRDRRRDPRDRLFPADPPGLRNLLHPQTRRGMTPTRLVRQWQISWFLRRYRRTRANSAPISPPHSTIATRWP